MKIEQSGYPFYVREGIRITIQSFSKGVLGYMTASIIPFPQWQITGACGGVMMASASVLNDLSIPMFNRIMRAAYPLTCKMSPKATEGVKAVTALSLYFLVGLTAAKAGKILTACNASILGVGILGIASQVTVLSVLGIESLVRMSQAQDPSKGMNPELLNKLSPELRQKWENLQKRLETLVPRLKTISFSDEGKSEKAAEALLDEALQVFNEMIGIWERNRYL